MEISEKNILISKLDDYVSDIERLEYKDIDTPSVLKLFEEKLISISDFISNEDILCKEFWCDRVCHFSDLIHNKQDFKQLTNALRQSTIDFWKNVDIEYRERLDFEKIFKNIFDTWIYADSLGETYQVNNYQDFINLLTTNENIWKFYSVSPDRDTDFLTFKGYDGVNYNQSSQIENDIWKDKNKNFVKNQLLGLSIPDGNVLHNSKAQGKSMVERFIEYTDEIPTQKYIKEFNYVAEYIKFLAEMNKTGKDYYQERYNDRNIDCIKNYKNLTSKDEEIFFIPTPRDKKADYLITVLRALKYYLQEQPSSTGEDATEQEKIHTPLKVKDINESSINYKTITLFPDSGHVTHENTKHTYNKGASAFELLKILIESANKGVRKDIDYVYNEIYSKEKQEKHNSLYDRKPKEFIKHLKEDIVTTLNMTKKHNPQITIKIKNTEIYLD